MKINHCLQRPEKNKFKKWEETESYHTIIHTKSFLKQHTDPVIPLHGIFKRNNTSAKTKQECSLWHLKDKKTENHLNVQQLTVWFK